MFKTQLFFIILLLFSLNSFAKVLVISDLDDTIKKSNTLHKLSAFVRVLIPSKSYSHMELIYNDLKKSHEDIDFHYVSSSYKYFYNAGKFVKKHDYPEGTYSQRKRGSGKSEIYKLRTIKNIIADYEMKDVTRIYFFGDNVTHDPVIYTKLVKQLNLTDVEIYIRDMKYEASNLTSYIPEVKLDGVKYFVSAFDLLGTDLRNQISRVTALNIRKSFEDKTIIPKFGKSNLRRILRKNLCASQVPNCRSKAKSLQKEIFADYYSQK